jgi:hypothetical protein
MACRNNSLPILDFYINENLFVPKKSSRHQNSREREILCFCGGRERNKELEKGKKEDDDHEEEEGEVRKFKCGERGCIYYKEAENLPPSVVNCQTHR